jgi:alkylation response protein AidB-like acyl-CoA dehydrogenase
LGGDVPRSGPKNLGDQPMADVAVPADTTVLDEGPSARAAFQPSIDEAKVLVASTLVGMASKAHEIALDYVKVRKAFGVTLATFQTVAHRLASDVVNFDGARFLSREAAWAIEAELPNADSYAAAAFAFCAESAYQGIGNALHVHGGIGFTAESDIQLYYRRAVAWPMCLGDPRQEFRRVARLVWDREHEQVA